MTTTAERATIAHRTADALKLRQAGHTYREIAAELDVSTTQVFKDVQRALADIPKAEADTLRQLEVERLDNLQAALWESALLGDLGASQQVLKVIDRRIKLLGLDAPQKVDVSTGDVDLDGTVQKLLAVAEAAGEHTGSKQAET